MLSKIRPINYVFLYFFQIFVFTLLYAAWAEDFYHSTAQFEPTIRHENTIMENEIRSGLIKESHSLELNKFFDKTDYQVDLKYVAGVENYKIRISETSTHLYLHGFAEIHYFNKQFMLALRLMSSPSINQDNAQSQGKWSNSYLQISDNFIRLHHGFGQAALGKASRITDIGNRMFYLSAVTSSTLGYGDIVPLTNTTRILVALQSLMGLLLMGGFISAVMMQRET